MHPWCLVLINQSEEGVGNQQVVLDAFAQQLKAIAVHSPNAMLPYNSSPLFFVPANSVVEVLLSPSITSLLVAGVSRSSVSKSAIELLSDLLCARHCGGVHAYDGDEAFVAHRKAKLHKPFICAGEKARNLRSLSLLANPTPCILSSCRALPFQKKV